jgi:2-amino-4-hydroxy-6-hydroxymethyldihydropteridine diphosphokinase
MTRATHTALLGIGSNLGDRRRNVERAVELLAADGGVEVVRVSRLIETQAVGGPPQGDYLNGAVSVLTVHSPSELLALLQGVEATLGRVRAERNGPRTIDLDILLFDDATVADPELDVPHPRMLERAFVLEPLAEIAPDHVHPASGKTMRDHWSQLQRQGSCPDS